MLTSKYAPVVLADWYSPTPQATAYVPHIPSDGFIQEPTAAPPVKPSHAPSRTYRPTMREFVRSYLTHAKPSKVYTSTLDRIIKAHHEVNAIASKSPSNKVMRLVAGFRRDVAASYDRSELAKIRYYAERHVSRHTNMTVNAYEINGR